MSVLLALALVAVAPVDPVPAPTKAQIETIVRDYILTHPEILPEALERLQQRDTARAIAANAPAIFEPFGAAWAGAADADVTLVEFFDYNCGYCRASRDDVDRLLREDERLRVVYREFPVLGDESRMAARLALAAARQGRYSQLHRRLFEPGATAPASLAKLAREFALTANPDDRTSDMEIERNIRLARLLGLSGTPTWVVGERVLSGAVGYDTLKRAIAEARAAHQAKAAANSTAAAGASGGEKQ